MHIITTGTVRAIMVETGRSHRGRIPATNGKRDKDDIFRKFRQNWQ